MTEPCAIPAFCAADVYSRFRVPVLSHFGSLSCPVQQKAELVQSTVAKQVNSLLGSMHPCVHSIFCLQTLCNHAHYLVTVFTAWLYALKHVLQFTAD